MESISIEQHALTLDRFAKLKRAFRYQKAAMKLAATLVYWTHSTDDYASRFGEAAKFMYHRGRQICDRLIAKLNHCNQKAKSLYEEATAH